MGAPNNRGGGDDAFAPVSVRASIRNAWTPAAANDDGWDQKGGGGGGGGDYSERRQRSKSFETRREDLLDPSRSFHEGAGAGGDGGDGGGGGGYQRQGQGHLTISEDEPPGNTGHDPHITYTLYAVQCFALCNRLEECDKEGIANCETLDPFFFHLNLSDVVFYF